ncbi:hypothetical protein HJC99_05680 [Candidatus Saccharibacteria bacterium]|nr:hypothetical protein [Candidatus Saccharibacteria bacterium]
MFTDATEKARSRFERVLDWLLGTPVASVPGITIFIEMDPATAAQIESHRRLSRRLVADGLDPE